MRGGKVSIIVAAACSILFASTCVLAEDSPQWRGPNRDAKVTGFTAPAAWPKTLTQKWKVTVGAGDATPALVGDRLYVFAREGGDEVTLCLDAATGKQLWKDAFAVPAIVGPAAKVHAGPRSSPAVADGRIVTLGVTGVLSCLDVADGKVVWRNQDYKGAPKFYTASSPMIVDGMCIAQVGGGASGAIVALDMTGGTEKWKWTGEGPGYASPVLLNVDGVKQIVALTEKSIVGVSAADGKLLWQLPFAAQGMSYNAATPIVDGQTVIYIGQGRGAHAIKIEKRDNGFAAKELWSNPNLSVQFSNPVLKDGMLYAISDKGNLWCMDAQTGKAVWTDIAKRGNYGPMLDVGSAILALTEKSQLIAFKPAEKQYTELADIKVADSNTYAYPVAAGNAIYVKDQNDLIMWTVE